MLYLTCTTKTSIDLAHYGVSCAKDWVSVKCGTIIKRGKIHVVCVRKKDQDIYSASLNICKYGNFSRDKTTSLFTKTLYNQKLMGFS